MIPIIVLLKDQADTLQAAQSGPGASRQERVIRSLQAKVASTQKGLLQELQTSSWMGKTGKLKPFWIVNGFSLQATPEVIQFLATRPEVKSIIADQNLQASTSTHASNAAWDNLGKIQAPQMWSLGFRGQGVVVANIDTGVDSTHPELSAQWRGGTNSWYDPVDPPGTHLTPADLPISCGQLRGHGTGTMGVMVGQTTGVAPQARWIAAKIFDDATCTATTSNAVLGLQWVLDPDGNPASADAPQVVNNSWGAPGCDTALIFQPVLQNLRAAGILPVFAAGNGGIAVNDYPANYPEAFSVGATDSQDSLASFSSRGPNTCVTPWATFPNIVAPGVSITLPAPGGGYTLNDGTSFAAPHVAGGLALLLSAFPQGLTIPQQETALQVSAVDLGTPGPDNSYGSGRLDVLAAYQSLLPVSIGFASPSLSILENAGTASLTIQLTHVSIQPVTISFSTGGGTAVSGVDYTLPGPLTFNPGETQKAAQIVIFDDGSPGPNKTLVLDLISPLNATVDRSVSQIVLTIVNSNPWKLSFPLIYK